VEIRYEPFKEIVIRNLHQFESPEAMGRYLVGISGGGLPPIKWLHGIGFLEFWLLGDGGNKMMVKGKRRLIEHLYFVKMPLYSKTVKVDGVDLQVLPAGNAQDIEIVHWLKNQMSVEVRAV